MPDEIRVSRPPQAPMQHSQQMGMQQEAMPAKSSKMPWVVLVVVVVVIAVLAVLFRGQLFKGSGSSMTAGTSGASGYQAVFLTNGQVYFGKLADANSDYPVLTDIYYLQVVQQPPLQGQQNGSTTTQAQAQQSISLVKLGNELHGPVDEMHISKSQVLFYEDMKTDSQVVKAILAYKANPTGAAAPVPSK